MNIKEDLVQVEVVGTRRKDTDDLPVTLHHQLGELAAATATNTLVQQLQQCTATEISVNQRIHLVVTHEVDIHLTHFKNVVR